MACIGVDWPSKFWNPVTLKRSPLLQKPKIAISFETTPKENHKSFDNQFVFSFYAKENVYRRRRNKEGEEMTVEEMQKE